MLYFLKLFDDGADHHGDGLVRELQVSGCPCQ